MADAREGVDAAAMSNTSVEVAIVSFNTREILRATLRSLLDHQPSEHDVRMRVSVLDNNSTDGSADMVQAEFPDVALIRSMSNAGFGEAHNIIARQSAADYILLLNSDVILREDIVTPLVAALNSDPNAIVASPRLIWPDGRVQLSAQALPNLAYEFALVLRGTRLGRAIAGVFDSEARVEAVRQTQATVERANGRRPDFIWATCWMIRGLDARSVGPFSRSFPMYDEDLDFCHRAREGGRTLIYLPEVELVHLGGSSSTSSAKRELMSTARGRYYRAHHGRAAEYIYRFGTKIVQTCVSWVAAVPRPRRDWRP